MVASCSEITVQIRLASLFRLRCVSTDLVNLFVIEVFLLVQHYVDAAKQAFYMMSRQSLYSKTLESVSLCFAFLKTLISRQHEICSIVPANLALRSQYTLSTFSCKGMIGIQWAHEQ